MLGQIRRCYLEMDKFWREEICHAAKALEMRRVDPSDVERWKNFHASLKETIDSWKVLSIVLSLCASDFLKYLQNGSPSGSSQDTGRSDPHPSTVCPFFLLLQHPYIWFGLFQGANIGEIASSLSPAMGSLEDTLKLIRSSASFEYTSFSDLSLLLRVDIAFTRNSSLCLNFLRHCADYQDFVVALCSPPITWPTSPRVRTSHSLCERAMRPPFETTSNSAENADGVEGLSL